MTDDANAAPDSGQAADVAESNQAASWLDGLGDDLKGYVESRGFKNPGAVVESYRNLEGLRGVPEERLLKLPADMADGEAMAAVYDRLGRPSEPTEYTNALGDGIDGEVYSKLAAKAHEMGLSDSQFRGMQEATQEISAAVLGAEEEASAKAFDDWKANNAEGFQNAARMMASLGVDDDALAGILAGDKTSLYDFLAKAAETVGESKIIKGDPPKTEFNMTPGAASQKIAELFADKDFMAQYTSTSAQVRQPAIERMTKLQEIKSRGA